MSPGCPAAVNGLATDSPVIAFPTDVAEPAVRTVTSRTGLRGGFHTPSDARTFLAVRGCIPTIRENSLRAATGLRNALLGNPWTPPTPYDRIFTS
ncbi:hypothetical protein Asi03nite_15410 [Actinoplanes siamensis]|uniref:Uncharacterized protein n=1 Tax=Actinoplanes siamensis TaxID=1223317 RepID=A0A919N414_9ACTN|nr:hypothetical protein Asi03nite_15410 [Actinoplanes siamensis]